MKKLLVAGIAATMFCVAPANAADMPVKAQVYKTAPPVMSWTGCYIGANAGGGWGNSSWTDVSPPGPSANIGDPNFSGALGGAQIGCNYQSGVWVFSVEGMWDFANLTGNVPNPLNSQNIEQTKTDWLGTATARLGYAVDRSLLYVKGGAAWVHDDRTRINPANSFDFHDARTSVGWTAGAGAEYMFAPQWSVKLEYNYIDLGNINDTLTCRGVGCPVGSDFLTIRERIHLVLVGLNYRFR